MTFPWKKAKSTLLSRLVADLHRPPQSGRTLVLETGFPTSLVDLFVKNRDRLRKSPKRKSTSQIQTPVVTRLPSSPPRSFPDPPCEEKAQSSGIDIGKSVMVQRKCAGGSRIGFRAAVKVIIVAALAVSTKQLTLWIMMAAFLLFLLEFGFSLPEFQSILLGFKKWDREQTTVLPGYVELIDMEIESEFNCVEETQMETRRERSRSGRFKRHLIKKLVPKKLRPGKKKNEDQWRADMHKREELEDESQQVKISRDDQVLLVKEEKLERGSSGQCLSVIVLAGLLLGGRGAALLITLVWCLMLTYIRRLRC
ncbi:uncharacterized protein LOC120138744 isoform X2 [Hibiscus syriacus]|uniref:uncharacterized protein LOC120138744 isoform X2 n=1 Tax=Hibiscus syriacus TaxID=106335 RepID=UPI001924B702|nr:uncharacterized protein LOC120138744 isoform X2 [Hibiscus syriacus]